MAYSSRFKARMLQRLIGPERISATRLSEETGVSQNTLSRWLREAREEGKRGNGVQKAAADRAVRPNDLPAVEKLRLVMEAAQVPENELGAFLRRHGLHEAQLEEWRQKVEEAALSALGPARKGRPRQSPQARELRELKQELARKDKALAEVTALLALKKKLASLLGDEDDDTSGRSGP